MACDCLDLLKSKLAETNTVPITAITPLDGRGMERLAIRTERILARRDGKKPTPVLSSFCPCCGVK